MTLTSTELNNIIRQALAEDIGSGDSTSTAIIPRVVSITGHIRVRENCIIAGLPVVEQVYSELDPSLSIDCLVVDGDCCEAHSTVATISGSARSVLTGERTALNFLQRLSGVATVTSQYVAALGDSTDTKILDTRKTTPGLRILEKYAVRMGGGTNHRMGLHDRIMIKDNHRYIASLEGPGGITRAIDICRKEYPALEVEVEADTLEQVREALQGKADYVLLDNMSNVELIEAVELRDTFRSQALLEASGGITMSRIPEIRGIGLDFISVGAITHSAGAIDIGLDFHEQACYPETPE